MNSFEFATFFNDNLINEMYYVFIKGKEEINMDRIEIKGKVNTAICYAKVVENEAIEQIRRMCDYPMTEGAKIRIMPDVHSGKGCTIGTTMTIKDRVVPNVVGVDIGCGMYTVCLGKGEIDFAKVDEAPMAYKSLDDIIDVIKDSVEIMEVMKPVYNFKA